MATVVAFLLVGNLAVFIAFAVVHSGSVESAGGWAAALVMLVPIGACFARALLGGPRRAAAVWLGVALVCWAAGNVLYVTWTRSQTDPPAVSPADLAYLGFYACAVAAVIALLRRNGRLTRSLWLDGAIGAAGAATALAAMLSPALAGAEGGLADVVIAAAYSIADLLLVGTIGGVLAIGGSLAGSLRWLAGGFTIFCAADVAYALQTSSGTYVNGTVLPVLWMIGITIFAFALWRTQPATESESRSTAILAVPVLATLIALTVLVIFSVGRDPVVVAMATLTLLLAVARALVVVRQVQRLSDARREAVTDELTGLGNRRSLFEHGERRLQEADRGDRLALILIDLDNFKEVNDTLGHHAGDELLRETARRLIAHLSQPDLLVRLGGDEFACLITLAADDDGKRIAERIIDRLAGPVVIEGLVVHVDASAGFAERDSSNVTVADLLRRADVAMYSAKAGSSQVECYSEQLDVANRNRLQTVRDLDAALAEDQFLLHFQPKIDLRTGGASGAEALARWQHPTRGLLYPDAFLPAVEQSGRMSALTRVVLQAAVTQLATWRESGLALTVAVNLSASDLLYEDLAERIAELLDAHGVPATALELEITESVLVIDLERTSRVLDELRRLGLRIAIDDYGTGYSALSYLRDLPIDALKIDRSFIADITANRRSAAIVRSTIELAHALDFKVVAEGVEHPEAAEFLAGFDCDFAQGYHFSRPLPAEAFTAWAHARSQQTALHALTP